jgi:hypothetical protein
MKIAQCKRTMTVQRKHRAVIDLFVAENVGNARKIRGTYSKSPSWHDFLL